MNEDFQPGYLEFVRFVRERYAVHREKLRRIIIPESWFLMFEDELYRVDGERLEQGKNPVFFCSEKEWEAGYDNFLVKGIPICCDLSAKPNVYREELND